MSKLAKVMLYLLILIIFHINPLYSQLPNFESELPIIIINTNGLTIVDEPKINANMGIIYNGVNEINKTTDQFNHYNGKIGIEIRGNTSQTFPKKSYAVETRDAALNDLNVSLLGMPEESDWVLYAPYSDKTLVRNAVAYKLARKLGHYAPRTKFCELIINNDYKGIYLLIEKIKRDDNRVDVSKLKDTDNSGDELTGGYIFKVDQQAGEENDGWASPYPREGYSGAGLFYQYHYPSQGDITNEQKAYIKQKVTSFENVMIANYRYDETLGYYNYLDMDDVVDFYIVSEACKNYDTMFSSFFLYKDKDSKDKKLHFGPVWDFNVSMGNAYDESFRSPEGWVSDLSYNPWGTPLGRPFWAKYIWQDTTFVSLFHSRMRSLRSNSLSSSTINSMISNMVDEISGSVDRNFTRWPILGVAITPIDLYGGGAFVFNSYDKEIEYLKDWWNDRLQWIGSIVGSPTSVDSTGPAIPSNFTATSFNGYVLLSWSPNTEPDLWSYNLYKGTTGWMDLLAVVNKNDSTYIDTSIANNTTYYYQISAQDDQNNHSARSNPISTTTLDISNENNNSSFNLYQNTPNPFNSKTNIKFSIPIGSKTSIVIYDISGNIIKTLFKEVEFYDSNVTVSWDGTNEAGQTVSAGIYLYSVNSGLIKQTKKMIYLK